MKSKQEELKTINLRDYFKNLAHIWAYKMRILLTLLLISFSTHAMAEIEFPETKYIISDCISPTDPSYSWFGKSARVEDIVYSKKIKDFTYRLFIPNSNISQYGLFSIWLIDLQTFKLIRCPF